MRGEVKLQYNAQLGTWFDPRTWFSDEKKLPAPAEDPTKVSSDFISPEWERVAVLEQEQEAYRKKMLTVVGVLVVLLAASVFLKKKAK